MYRAQAWATVNKDAVDVDCLLPRVAIAAHLALNGGQWHVRNMTCGNAECATMIA